MPDPMPDPRALIDALPQRSQLTDENIERWLSGIEGIQTGQPVEWHIHRLAGWGGSEIGSLVGEELGIFDPFATPRGLVRQKLLIDLPEPSTPKMQRGQRLEMMIGAMFLEKYEATRLPDLKHAIQAAIDPDHPWMSASVDDAVAIGGRRYLVDYKAPDTPPSKLPFHYHCQLNQYDALARVANEPIDGLVLCNFDYRHGELVDLVVPQDIDLQNRIRSVGDRYWSMVLSGEQPVFKAREALPPVTLTESRIESLRDLEQHYLGEVLMAKSHENNAAGLRSAIIEILNSAGDGPLKGFKSPTETVRMQIGEKIDIEAIDEALRKCNRDPAEIREVQKGKYDTDALVQYVANQGEDPDQFLLRAVDKAKAHEVIAELGLPMAPYIKETITLKMPTMTSKAGKALAPTREAAEILAAGASESFQSLFSADGEQAGSTTTIEVSGTPAPASPTDADKSSAAEKPNPEKGSSKSATTSPSPG